MRVAILRVCAPLLVLGLVACGGGGGGEQPPPPNEGPNEGLGWIYFNTPTFDADYSTDRPSIELAGMSFTPDGAFCGFPVGGLPPNFSITWSNQSAGTSGFADSYFCVIYIQRTVWNANIGLNLGENRIVVTSSDGAGNIGRDTITVTRVPDTTPPSVASVSPVNNATNIATSAEVVVKFSEPMDPASIANTANILLATGADPPVAATISYAFFEATATLTPSSPLAAGATYVLTVTTGVRDHFGNSLAAPFTSSFTISP